MSEKYTMTISRLTVDKLGVKLYDRVSAIIAEIMANSYDADEVAHAITVRSTSVGTSEVQVPVGLAGNRSEKSRPGCPERF